MMDYSTFQNSRVATVTGILLLLAVLVSPWKSSADAAEKTAETVAVIVYDTPFLDAERGLKDELRQRGYIENDNITYLNFNLKKDLTSIPTIIHSLSQNRCDVIVTTTTPVTIAVKQALRNTKPIPVVFTMVGDPLKAKIVPTLKKPGGFITGVAYNAFTIMPKKLELLREAFPALKKLAIFYNPKEEWLREPIEALLKPVAQQLAFQIITYSIDKNSNFETVATHINPDIDGIFMVPAPLNISIFSQLTQLSRQRKIPLMVLDNSLLAKGGVIGYSPSFYAIGQQAAALVERILNGALPGNLAVQNPQALQLVVSLREANQLGITVPATFLRCCDEIIR